MANEVEIISRDQNNGGKRFNGPVGHYETIAASQTAQVLGATGAQFDFLERLVCVVTTAATGAVSIKDGAGGTLIPVFPNSPGGGIGTYNVELNLRALTVASPGWRVTTGAGVAVIAVGAFT